MNEDTWLAVLQALPTSINTPLIVFDNPTKALAWIQLNYFEESNLWIVTNDKTNYWVVTGEVGKQLLRMGFIRLKATPPPTPPQSLTTPGDERA
ncbi:hypothetical protein GCM10027347_40130 [Larkinella harenae]